MTVLDTELCLGGRFFSLVLAIFTHFNTNQEDFYDTDLCQIIRQRITLRFDPRTYDLKPSYSLFVLMQ